MVTWKRIGGAGAVLACLGLSPGCASSDGGDATGAADRAAEPLHDAVKDVERDYDKAAAQHEDVIDRVFAPLDDTVTDINRDLNREKNR